MNGKAELLLEELGLKKPTAANRMEWNNMGKTPQNDEGQKGTDEPWKHPAQSSQDPKQKPPPKPDYGKRERES